MKDIFPLYYHGLYGSTSCCISHGPSQWERAIFDPHTAPNHQPIFMKLEIYNYFPDTLTDALTRCTGCISL